MNWQEKLNINQIVDKFNTNLCDEELIPHGLKDEIRLELIKSKKIPKLFQEDLGFTTLVVDFNDWLRELYDFCDEKKIWLGFPDLKTSPVRK